jgi:hypothetical protein
MSPSIALGNCLALPTNRRGPDAAKLNFGLIKKANKQPKE